MTLFVIQLIFIFLFLEIFIFNNKYKEVCFAFRSNHVVSFDNSLAFDHLLLYSTPNNQSDRGSIAAERDETDSYLSPDSSFNTDTDSNVEIIESVPPLTNTDSTDEDSDDIRTQPDTSAFYQQAEIRETDILMIQILDLIVTLMVQIQILVLIVTLIRI